MTKIINVILTSVYSILGTTIINILLRTKMSKVSFISICSSKTETNIDLDCLSLENGHKTVEHIDLEVLNKVMKQKIQNSKSEFVSEKLIFPSLKANEALHRLKITTAKIINKLLGS